ADGQLRRGGRGAREGAVPAETVPQVHGRRLEGADHGGEQPVAQRGRSALRRDVRHARTPWPGRSPRTRVLPTVPGQRRVDTVTVNFGVCSATRVGPTSRVSVGL